jgi:hypothetical protein
MAMRASGCCLVCGQYYLYAESCESKFCHFATFAPSKSAIIESYLQQELEDDTRGNGADSAGEGRGVPVGTVPRSDRLPQPTGESDQASLLFVSESCQAVQSAGNGPARVAGEPEKRAELYERDGPNYDADSWPDEERACFGLKDF